MHIQFVNGWVLFLIWAVLVLAAAWFMLFRRKQTTLRAFLAEPMLSKLAPAVKPARFYAQFALALSGLLLLLVAAARPQWGSEERIVFQRGRDLIIALDVSRSMLARDAHPDRLQRAKADIQDLLRELRGDRVGLMAFRGHAVQLCPLTTDYGYIEQTLDEVTPESAPRGETNIGDAIYKALDAFENDSGSHRAIILISDGEDLAGQAKAATARAKEKGVVIFTVGLGNPEGSAIPGLSKAEAHQTYQGSEVITKLHHETLKEIAEATGGAYVPVGVANVKLGKLYRDHLSRIAARDLEESLQQRMIERYQWFLFPAVLALLVAAFLSRGRLAARNTLPNARKKTEGAMDNNTKTFFPDLRAAKRMVFLACLTFAFQAGQIFAGTNVSSDQAASNKAAVLAGGPAVPRADASSGSLSNFGQGTVATERDGHPVNVTLPDRSFLTGRAGACKAQDYYRLGAYDKAAAAYLYAMSNSAPLLKNDCLYNAGCAYYRGNNFTDASQCFNRLAAGENIDQSKVYYNLGCATFRLAEEAEKQGTNRPPEMKPFLLEKSGAAFQRALRAKSDHKDASANLAAITNMLPKAREEAKINALMAKYANQPPGQLADTMLQNQRNILRDLSPGLTNSAPSRIQQFENLAEQQRANADVLIPLKLTLANALNAQGKDARQQIQQLEQHLEATRNSMNEAYNNMRDIDNRAFHPVAASERGIYNLWKGLAEYGRLLSEDIRRQTNTICLTTSVLSNVKGEMDIGASLATPVPRAATSAAPTGNGNIDHPAIQEEQKEAQELTRLFADRFSKAVPPGGSSDKKLPGARPAAPFPPQNQGAAESTNETPQISNETRTNILYLADQAVKTQEKAFQFLNANKPEMSLPEQRRSHDLLKEIERLLPKNKNPQQNQNQQQQNNQQQEQNKPQEQQQPPKEDKQQPPPQEQQPPPQNENKQNEQKPEQPREQPAKPEKKDEKEMTPEQMRALLDKAEQREKEHREEKMRDEYIPPSPVDRDW